MSESIDRSRGSIAYLKVYSELITAARYQGLVTYQAIAQLVGLPLVGSYMGSQIGTILGYISEDEVAAGRPMLSALAVGVSGKPGPGFAALAKQLGRLQEGSPDEDVRFWEKERNAVYAAWKADYDTKGPS